MKKFRHPPAKSVVRVCTFVQKKWHIRKYEQLGLRHFCTFVEAGYELKAFLTKLKFTQNFESLGSSFSPLIFCEFNFQFSKL